jgi:hypothetical protein
MAYKIAVASKDGTKVDLSFGEVFLFYIYEAEGTNYKLYEKRKYELPVGAGPQTANSPEKRGCGSAGGCGAAKESVCGNGGGCGSAGGTFPKVELIRDCRCVICKKIGFQVQKQFEKLAITGFDVDCTVEEALQKITAYLDKIDKHQSLRGIQHKT